MKKSFFAALSFLAFGAAALAAFPQAQEPAAPLEKEVRQAILLAPHYGIFDNLLFKLDGAQVTLLGQVMLPITKEEASRRVSKLAGVAQVVNDIEVLPMSRSDDVIRLQVYRRLFGAADLYRYALGPDPSIHIIVKSGRVNLEGAVSSEADSRFAEHAVHGIHGVFSVANNLRIEK